MTFLLIATTTTHASDTSPKLMDLEKNASLSFTRDLTLPEAEVALMPRDDQYTYGDDSFMRTDPSDQCFHSMDRRYSVYYLMQNGKHLTADLRGFAFLKHGKNIAYPKLTPAIPKPISRFDESQPFCVIRIGHHCGNESVEKQLLLKEVPAVLDTKTVRVPILKLPKSTLPQWIHLELSQAPRLGILGQSTDFNGQVINPGDPAKPYITIDFNNLSSNRSSVVGSVRCSAGPDRTQNLTVDDLGKQLGRKITVQQQQL